MKCWIYIIPILLLNLRTSFAAPRYGCSIELRKDASLSQRYRMNKSAHLWENGQLLKNGQSVFSAFPDTLRILAILAEFKTDVDEKTTGNGKFIFSSLPDATIDPPPHNADYFQNQLLALANYYRTVSGGKLILLGSVVPQVVTLNHEMGYYNPGTTEEALNKGLAILFRDVIRAADSIGISFAKNDVFVVFHAGVGKDLDLGLDATPKDIPSVFLALKDLQKYLAADNPAFQGIAVEKGQQFVREGILLPETESQDGYEIGLLGTAALMFGFQLGLPALWDTQTGRSGIGRWGLMDQGSGNFNGLIPAEPDAFSKVLLGWEKPVELRQGDRLQVACSAARYTKKIYKVPINENEYFLIENRSHDPDVNGIAYGWDRSGNRIQFTAEGNIKSDKPFGVIVRVDEYDFGLPGSGILIWHVDESIVQAKLSENKINSDKNRRGLDLEEADGAQDLGESYGMLEGGAGSETGVLHDAWYADNEINKLVNKIEEVSFAPELHPSSRSNSGANTHIVISHFSSIDTLMTFSVTTDSVHPGFPQYFTQGLHPYPPLNGDLDGDGQHELVVATREGKVFAWKQNGSKVIQNAFTQNRSTIGGGSVTFPLALFSECTTGISVPPVLDEFYLPGRQAVIRAASGDRMIVWATSGLRPGGLADRLLDTTLTGRGITALTTIDGRTFIGTHKGIFPAPVGDRNLSDLAIREIGLLQLTQKTRMVAVTEQGEVYWILWPNPSKRIASIGLQSEETINHLAIGSLPSNNAFMTLLTGQKGITVDTSGTVLGQWDNRFSPDSFSSPAIGDMDKDGVMEIVCSAGGQIWVFNTNGSLADHFPVPHNSRTVALSSPVLGDVDGDGQIEVVVTTSEGLVEAYRSDGSTAEGFPLDVGGSSAITPLLCDVDGDRLIELVAVSGDGVIAVWDMRGAWDSNTVPWPCYLHDTGYTAANMQPTQNMEPGQEIMPVSLVYNYPNPNIEDYTMIRYRLEYPARVTIQIFNMAGDLVKKMEGPGLAQTENEVFWDLRGMSSGIYFCRVTAKGNVVEKTVMFKIAVVN